MKKFDTRAYSISDFIEWDDNDLLELSPDFQRRSVWSPKAKSFLIDTILRGKPIPKIIITQAMEGSRIKRIVVDGQQRIRAILEYHRGDFKVSRAHNEKLSKYFFEDLPDNLDKEFIKYEIGVDLLFDVPYEEMLDIFARINSYTVSLNSQEKFNANYLGYFKQYVYRYGYKYVNYFLNASIISKIQVTRMREAELSADLFVALIDGVQTNKGIENFYKKYEDKRGDLPTAASKFDTIMSYVGAIYPPLEIASTNWSRVHLFYTLFTVIGHFLFEVQNLDKKLKLNLKPKDTGKLRSALDEISSQYDEISSNMEDPDFPSDFKVFITQSRRGTTDTAARVGRANFVCKKIIDLI